MKEFLTVLAALVVLIYAGFLFGVHHARYSVADDCEVFGGAKLGAGVVIECKVEVLK